MFIDGATDGSVVVLQQGLRILRGLEGITRENLLALGLSCGEAPFTLIEPLWT